MEDAASLPAENARPDPFFADAETSPFLRQISAERKNSELLKKKVRDSVNSATTHDISLDSPIASRDTKPHTHGVFVDVNAMKAKVRASLQKSSYNVADLYKTTGCWQRIARHPAFEQLTLGVIFVNAIWIAVDTDYNDAEVLINAGAIFQIMENLFCTFFTFELTVRFCSFRQTQSALKDGWFVFDSALVLTMVLETWVMSFIMLITTQNMSGGMGNASILRIARLLRLSRMARMARLLRAMPELMIMIKGMIAAMRSVFFTLLLQIIMMYVFGIAFTQLLTETEVGKKHFSTVAESMFSLLMYGTFLDDITNLTKKIGAESPMAAAIFLVFVLLAALTVMNMLIGVLCEVVSAVAATEKEHMLVTWVRSKIAGIVQEIDTNGDNTISRTEFIKILENGNACRALRDVGVDVVGLVDLTDAIFESPQANEGKELGFGDFMDVILQLRGSNNATVKDVVDLRKLVNQMSMQTQEYLEDVGKRLDAFHKHETLKAPNGIVVPDDLIIRQYSLGSSDNASSRKPSKTSVDKTIFECRVEDDGCPAPLKSTLEADLLSRVQLADSATQWEELPKDQGFALAVNDYLGNSCHRALDRFDISLTGTLRENRSGLRAAGMEPGTIGSLQVHGPLVECQTLLKQLGGLGEILSTGMYEFEKIHSQLAQSLCIAAHSPNRGSDDSGGSPHK